MRAVISLICAAVYFGKFIELFILKPTARTPQPKWTKKPQQGLGALGLPDFREITHPSIVVITIGHRIRFQQLPIMRQRR
jgi:hypothetical protein